MNYLADNKQTFFDSFSEQFNSALTAEKNKAVNEQNALKTQIEQEQDKLKREYQHTQSTITEKHDKRKKEIAATLTRELATYQQLARQSIVLMPPYKTTKVNNIQCLYLAENEVPTLNDLRQEQARRIFLPALPVGIQNITLNDIHYLLPVYIDWQGKDNEQHSNLYISYANTERSKDEAYALHQSILMRILAAFPIGKVHFTFINPQKQTQYGSKWILEQRSSAATDLTTKDGQINNRDLLINNLFNGKEHFDNNADIGKAIENLQKRSSEITQILTSADKSLIDYNLKQQNIEQHYEVVVLYEPFNSADSGWGGGWLSQWKDMLRKKDTTKGIYSIVIQGDRWSDTFRKEDIMDTQRFLSEHFQHIACVENGICTVNNQECTNLTLFENQQFSNLFSSKGDSALQKDVINNLILALSEEKKKAIGLRRAPHEQWLDPSNKPIDTWNDERHFSVPVGLVNGEVFNFELGDESRVHTFLLGKTGSGKSVFIEDLIVSATAKYTPRSLHLYLIDFKDGVTIKPYAHLPHVQCTIASGDKTVQYVMLQKIEDERQRRNRLFANTGDGTLDSYNKKQLNDADKLPRIIVLYDEFSSFFIQDAADTVNHDKDRLQNLINTILYDIATKGRSAGIHLVMATQTLEKVMVDELCTQSSNNSYLFKSTKPADVTKLLKNEKAQEAVNHLDKIDKLAVSTYVSKGNMGFLELYLLDKGVGELDNSKHTRIIQALTERANATLQGNSLPSHNFEYPSDNLPPCYEQCKALIPSNYEMVLGTDILGQRVVGFPTFDNTLICSEDNASGKTTALRLMWSLMQTTFNRLGHHQEQQETYIGNLTKNPRVHIEGIDYITAFYSQNYAQRCEKADDINNTLIYLYKALKKREETEDNEHAKPLFFYIFDADTVIDRLDYRQPVNLHEPAPSAITPIQQENDLMQAKSPESFGRNRRLSVTADASMPTMKKIYTELLQEGFKYKIYIIQHTTRNEKELFADFPYQLFLHSFHGWNSDKIMLFSPKKLGMDKYARVIVVNTTADTPERIEQLALPFAFPTTEN